MAVRTVAGGAGTPVPAVAGSRRAPAVRLESSGGDPTAEQALEEAVARIADLAGRLWAVRRAHRPVPARGLRGVRAGATRLRCADCGRPFPCPTVQAAGPR